MLCRTSRLLRLTFDALLCGPQPTLPPPPQLAESCARLMETYSTQCSSSAPPPVALAAAAVATSLMQGQLRTAAGLLATHPRQQPLLRAVQAYVGHYPAVFTPPLLRGMAEEARCVSDEAVCTFLQAAAHQCASGPVSREGGGGCGREAAAAAATEEAVQEWSAQRQEVRAALLRHIRFHPAAASSLLRPLCVLSDGSVAEREEVISAMRSAMQQNSINPADLGYVLEMLWRCGESRRMAQMWEWVQHTSACWDPRAVSAAVMAFAHLGQLEEAVACMQRLAEAGCDPSVEAQTYFIRFLGRRSPPMAQYAEQLVHHWYPTPERMWTGAAQGVAMELARLRSRCGQKDAALELLVSAHPVLTAQPAEARRLLAHPYLPALLQRGAAQVKGGEMLQKRILDTVEREPQLLENNGERVALLLSLGLVTGRLQDVYAVLQRVPIDAAVFASAMSSFARGEAARAAPADVVVACIEEAASRTGNTAPPEITAWLQLAQEV